MKTIEALERENAELRDELAVAQAICAVNEQAMKLTDKQRSEWIRVFRLASQILRREQ